MTRGISLAFEKLDREDALRDLQETVEDASQFGKVGVVGYCFGGLLTWLSSCELNGVTCASAYYGGGIAGEAAQPVDKPRESHRRAVGMMAQPGLGVPAVGFKLRVPSGKRPVLMV